MNSSRPSSIRNSIFLLILVAVLPAMILLARDGLRQRTLAVAEAEKQLFAFARLLADREIELVRTTRVVLSTMALYEPLKNLDLEHSQKILQNLIEKDQIYQNFSITDLKGEVLVSARPMKQKFLGDRKHVRHTLAYSAFAVGEFVTSRSEDSFSALSFSQPIMCREGKLKAVLTALLSLDHFGDFFQISGIPDDLVIAITDEKGIYLFNSIKTKVGMHAGRQMMEKTENLQQPGVFSEIDEDGERRIFSCHPVSHLNENGGKIMIWASFPESRVLKQADFALITNLGLMLLVLLLSLTLSYFYGRNAIQKPLNYLIELTSQLQSGQTPAEKVGQVLPAEIRAVSESFFQMAESIINGRRELENEAERLAVTLRSIGDGVIATDTEGRITLFNPAAEEITGWMKEEACGKKINEIFAQLRRSDGIKPENPVEKVLKTGKTVAMTDYAAFSCKDGRQKEIADSGSPLRSSGGDIIGVVMVFRDVTRENQIRRELDKINKLESIGILAGGIAHDFNNILAAILGSIELAQLYANDSARAGGFLQMAQKACLKAKDITYQLLTFSRGGAPIKETACLSELIRETAAFVLHGSKTACRFAISENLWSVEIDKTQIGQVFQNLILNASQAMPDGGEILIKCCNYSSAEPVLPGETPGQIYVKVEIKDNGPGISAEDLKKIFDPFFSTKTNGHGLGLAISHSIVMRHHGHIWVDSEPGFGSKFTLLLPAGRDAEPVAAPKASKKEVIKSLSVLIMDDEPMIRDTASMILQEMGHRVVTAEDGVEAIGLYEKMLKNGEKFDLVIMDLTVPGGMGGKEAIVKLKQLDPDAKVIVSSGFSHDPVMADFKGYGFAEALPKPFDTEALKEVISRIT